MLASKAPTCQPSVVQEDSRSSGQKLPSATQHSSWGVPPPLPRAHKPGTAPARCADLVVQGQAALCHCTGMWPEHTPPRSCASTHTKTMCVHMSRLALPALRHKRLLAADSLHSLSEPHTEAGLQATSCTPSGSRQPCAAHTWPCSSLSTRGCRTAKWRTSSAATTLPAACSCSSSTCCGSWGATQRCCFAAAAAPAAARRAGSSAGSAAGGCNARAGRVSCSCSCVSTAATGSPAAAT